MALQEKWHITRSSPHYPALLAESPFAPNELYADGQLSALTMPAIAIVGSRAHTRYGAQVCEWLVPQLVDMGFCIVSGLASGIDALAHTMAISAGGTSIAVLANGLSEDVLYPKEHVTLARNLLQANGLILSEYSANQAARQHQFIARNRIIAGLCVGTIVIEAKEKSGALVTAKYSLEANREVWAVPGSIFSSRSSGTNGLIRQGAIPLTEITDVINHLPASLKLTTATMHAGSNAQVELFLIDRLSLNAQAILKAINTGYSSLLQIQQQVKLHQAELAACLTELEIAGIVRKNPDYTYELLVRL